MIKLSDGGVLLAKSNVLGFARTDNQSTNEPTLFNRLTSQFVYPNVSTNWNFFQKFKTGDVILTQIATIHTINSFKIYSSIDDSLAFTITIPSVTKPFADANLGTINYYDISIDTSLYGGKYYAIFTINTTQTYRSEDFQVDAFTDSEGVQITWYNNVDSNYEDYIYYDGTQQFKMRLEARFFEMVFGETKSNFKNWSGNQSTLTGQPNLSVKLDLSGFPPWLMEKLNIILQHDNLLINDLSVSSVNPLESENVKIGEIKTLIYTGSVLLGIDNYEVYDQLEAAAATEDNRVKSKDGQFITAGGRQIKYK